MHPALRLLGLLAIAAFALGGCIKSKVTSTIAADNTATLQIRYSLKLEAIERMKEMAAMAEDQGVEGAGAEATGQIDEVLKIVDEKAAVEELKKTGVEVVSSKAEEKGGWKTLEIQGKVADVNAWVEKAGKEADKKRAKAAEDDSNPLAKLGGAGGSLSPRFYKTADPKIGQVVLIPELSGSMDGMGMPDLGEMDDEQRDMMEQMLQSVLAQFSADEMAMEMAVTLPGKITGAKGGKIVDGNTLVVATKGTDITLESMSSLLGLKNGVSATFEIPEGCKIVFADPPAADTKKEEPAKEGEEDGKKPKKGGLKIGD
jgi:hypothetical protein